MAKVELSDKDIAQIEAIYSQLAQGDRLVVPGQVAREFARNRSAKLGELVKTVQDQMSRLGNPLGTKFSFLQLLPEYQHALRLSSEIEEKQKELKRSLKDVLEKVRSWSTDDPVWEIYRRHFEKCVVELDEDAQEKLPADLKFRTKHSIPPGYKEEQKSDGGSGDLIIWKTLLQVGASRRADVVFVTLDQKSDWWTQAAGGALYPRFELVEEFGSATGGFTIHLLLLSEFLTTFGAQAQVVEEVQRVEHEAVLSTENEGASDEITRSNPTQRRPIEGEIIELRRLLAVRSQELIEAMQRREELRESSVSRKVIDRIEREIQSLLLRQGAIRGRIASLTARQRSGRGLDTDEDIFG